MNKSLFMAITACAALAMTSCSSEDLTGADAKANQTAISFGTYIGRVPQSRSGETRTGADFGVLAYYTGSGDFNTSISTPDFMYNQLVKHNTSGYTYDPVKYWPATPTDKVSFFAYAPYSTDENISTSTVDKQGTPTVTVTIPSKLENSTDFVAASMVNQIQATNNGTVKFLLKHEMTRLTISAKVSDEVYKDDDEHNKTYVVIKNIKFNKGDNNSVIYGSGVYTFDATNKVNNLQNTVGTWIPTASENDLVFDGMLNTEQVNITKEGASNPYNVTGVKLTGTSETKLMKNDAYAYLIPITGEGLKSNSATATIEYDIVTIDSKLAKGYVCTSTEKTLNLPDGILKQGVSYNLLFNINVKEVTLDADVDQWSTTDAGTIEVN